MLLLMQKLIGHNTELLLPSRTKVNVVHAGLSQQSVQSKDVISNKHQTSSPSLNKSLLIVLVEFTKMKDVTVVSWIKPSNMLLIMVSQLKKLMPTLEETVHAKPMSNQETKLPVFLTF